MGILDEWIKVFTYGLGWKKKNIKEYYDTNEEQFYKDIPEGVAFVFVAADRFIDPIKNGAIDFLDMVRGAIQGVTGSYWQHAGVGLKLNGNVRIIESLEKVTENDLSVYFKPEYQMKLFFPPLNLNQSLNVWERAKSTLGLEYDYGEILDHVSILRKIFGIRFGDFKKYVCSSLARWIFKPEYTICNPKVKDHECVPKHINTWMNRDVKSKLMVYNLNPYIYN
jgi:hypothetical protein